MADIFLSYASADLERAKRFVPVLEKHGWSVWWDKRIRAGTTFAQVIEEAAKAARCVIVLWSQASVRSDWVQNEASEGLQRRILIPVLIDDVPIPFEFRRVQAANLIGWDGGDDHPELNALLDDIAGLLGPSPGNLEPQRTPTLPGAVQQATPHPKETRKTISPRPQGPPPRVWASKTLKYAGIVAGAVLTVALVTKFVPESTGPLPDAGPDRTSEPRPPGIYMRVHGTQGDPLTRDKVLIVPRESGSELVDRPYDFERHLKGSCLAASVSVDGVLTWNDVGKCQ